MEFNHVSVLLHETVDNLEVKPQGVYVDGTLGGGGHAYEVCKKLGESGRFIGIDQDETAIAAASERLQPFQDKTTFIRSNYVNFKTVLKELQIEKVDGIVLDLGVSSYQLDTVERGFSYKEEGAPLDMRMDQRESLSARDIVNSYTEEELYRIFHDYGEEKFSRKIARAIVSKREESPLETTGDLVQVIRRVKGPQIKGGHPAKKVFQAIRIECNAELDVLKNSLDDMIDALNPGGRICIITFHSLEDRIVKNIFRKNEDPCTCPKTFPMCICGKVSKGKVITRKPILPSEEEMAINRRSKSAKLRVFQKK